MQLSVRSSAPEAAVKEEGRRRKAVDSQMINLSFKSKFIRLQRSQNGPSCMFGSPTTAHSH
jgi:hypothetical protein